MGGDFFGLLGQDAGFRRRRRRLFDQGELRLVILQAISEKAGYGYEIIKAIEDKVNGAYSPSPCVVYPTLTLLEELGYVAAASRPDGKKIHSITAEGEAFLQANREVIDATFRRVAAAINEQPAPQIVRALENLHFALRLRLEQGPLSEAEAKTIAAALDRTALRIEQK
jgi:DNA-binding PadR family transcriptional regulator